MQLTTIESDILRNRGDNTFIDGIILTLTEQKRRLDWQMTNFMAQHCPGVLGIKQTDLDTSNPKYRYFNYKCEEYSKIERLIRVARAYKS